MDSSRQEYFKQYYADNLHTIKERARKYHRDDPQRKKDRDREYYLKNVDVCIARNKHWLKENPWFNSYRSAYQRCTNPNSSRYKSYGGRGIKLLMTNQDFQYLWFRDMAFTMTKPSIDRIDNDGNYELSNCRFIEQTKNIRHSTRT